MEEPAGGGRRIKLSLDGLKTEKGSIPIPELIHKLGTLQDIIYTIGDYLLNEPYKESGRRSSKTVDKCTLIFKDIKPGSTDLISDIGDCQTTLSDSGLPVGIQATKVFCQVIDIVAENDDPRRAVEDLITDPNYRNRTARLIENLLPRESDQVKVAIDVGDGKKRWLQPGYRPRVNKLITGHDQGEEILIEGAITKVRLIGERNIELWTKDSRFFKCDFGSDLLERITAYVGHMAYVKVMGIADLNAAGETVGIKLVTDIDSASDTVLSCVDCDEKEIRFKEPISISIDVDLATERWVLRNDELGIYSGGRDYYDALTNFESEICLLIHEYVQASDDELTKDAIELKKRMIKYIEG